MKRPFYFGAQLALCSLLALSLSGCAWLSKRKSLFEEQEQASSATVSRAEYDRLKTQHDELTNRYNLLQNELRGGQQPQASARPNQDIIGQLRGAPELAETVDVFAQSQQPASSASATPTPSTAARPIIDTRDIEPAIVEEHILVLRNSSQMIVENRFDGALRELKKIESSPIRQIRVCAKFNLGEILFVQGEYDLAMQIFEEIIRTEAFSGLVLKTLGRLIVCSEKLNLEQKKEAYYSILHDFFEQA